tara:strand:- start:619 stop:876 length:258 start_codon:yes stop_codon:yes gene_type:complete
MVNSIGSNRYPEPLNEITYMNEMKWCKAYIEQVNNLCNINLFIDDSGSDIILYQMEGGANNIIFKTKYTGRMKRELKKTYSYKLY